MTRINTNKVKFGCRVAAVLLHEGHVLLQGEPHSPIWTLPGGGVDLLESSHQALQREMREELEIDIHIERLLWVIEQFFESGGKAYHEIGFYFLVTPLAAPWLLNLGHVHHATEGALPVLFQWFNIEELAQLTLYPEFLISALRSLPSTPNHIILDDLR